jgi:hypothetical protein
MINHVRAFKNVQVQGARRVDELRVGTGAYPYNQTRGAAKKSHCRGNPLWLPGEQAQRSRWGFFNGSERRNIYGF